jgi:hypothetical protein
MSKRKIGITGPMARFVLRRTGPRPPAAVAQQTAQALPVTPQQTAQALPVTPQQTAQALPVTPQQTAQALPVTPQQTAQALPVTPQQTAQAPRGIRAPLRTPNPKPISAVRRAAAPKQSAMLPTNVNMYPNLPAVPPRSPLGDALIGANLLSVDRNQKPQNPLEDARRLSVPPNGLPGPANVGIGSANYETLIRQDPRFQQWEDRYNISTPFTQELAKLTGNNLINIPNTGTRLAPNKGALIGLPVNYGNLEGIDLRTNPVSIPGSKGGQTMDFYNFNPKLKTSQQIILSPAASPPGALHPRANPITTFIHEGRHAIDDLYKRPHQTEMINFLAQEEARNPGVANARSRQSWLKPLIEGAQNLLPLDSFSRDYPYSGKGGVKEDIEKSFNALKDKGRGALPITNFQGARTALNNIRATPPTTHGVAPVADPGDSFKSLSEHTAFMAEAMNKPLNTRPLHPAAPIPDESRRFAKEILRTMYRDHEELSGGGTGGTPNSLATQYPNVHQSFFDRYNELRNPNYVNSPEPSRQAASAAKMNTVAPTAPLGAPPGEKGPLTAFDAITHVPNTFPAPKYTTRARGGHITTWHKDKSKVRKVRGLSQYLV